MFVCLCVCLSVCLCACVPVCLSVCLSSCENSRILDHLQLSSHHFAPDSGAHLLRFERSSTDARTEPASRHHDGQDPSNFWIVESERSKLLSSRPSLSNYLTIQQNTIMITLCLTLVPERKKVELNDNATLEDLYKIACSTFSIASCKLRHGYPSVSLPPLSDDSKKTMLLSTLKIQNQDRITVISSSLTAASNDAFNSTMASTKIAATAVIKQKENKTPASFVSAASATTIKLPPTKSRPSNNSEYIPGLTKSHYTKDSRNAATSSPTRIYSQVNGASFQFRWNATGSKPSSSPYQVSAEGNNLGSPSSNKPTPKQRNW